MITTTRMRPGWRDNGWPIGVDATSVVGVDGCGHVSTGFTRCVTTTSTSAAGRRIGLSSGSSARAHRTRPARASTRPMVPMTYLSYIRSSVRSRDRITACQRLSLWAPRRCSARVGSSRHSVSPRCIGSSIFKLWASDRPCPSLCRRGRPALSLTPTPFTRLLHACVGPCRARRARLTVYYILLRTVLQAEVLSAKCASRHAVSRCDSAQLTAELHRHGVDFPVVIIYHKYL